jgi:alpha-L-rhamnosidase
MGEFWANSPTHDKPNDMLDAISGAHIYGKNIVQAEAFTTLRSDWSEHPGSIKTIGDRAFAAGINKFALHVFMHSPWLDKKPGMTLDGIGLFYQRYQTWFKQSKAWIDYLTRCQALLQLGKPVVDIAVFTGEEIPGRAILPDRLVNVLPGLFGKERLQSEATRLLNASQPQRTMPAGVTHSANMADPENWVDALHGYSYDCFNPDVLLQMSVENGRIVTPGGASYAVLVIPGKHPMNPNATMSDAVQYKLRQLAKGGARMIIDEKYFNGFAAAPNIVKTPYMDADLKKLQVKPDLVIENNNGEIAWAHRRWKKSAEIFFFSNQTAKAVTKKILFNCDHTQLEIWNPVTGDIYEAYEVKYNDDNTETAVLKFEPGQSYFVVLRKEATGTGVIVQVPIETKTIAWVKDWTIAFMENDKPVKIIQQLLPSSWSQSADPFIKYFSGTAVYKNSFTLNAAEAANGIRIELPEVYNMASIKINGEDCGTLWTAPFDKYINKKLLRAGENKIEIAVTNTWRNRLIGDELMPAQKTTWLNSPYKMQDKGLLPAGLVGQVRIMVVQD